MESKEKIKVNKKIIIPIVITSILIFVIFGIVKLTKVLSKEIVYGNLSNMGLAVEKDGVIYYNKYEEGIVKIKAGKEYNITEETAYSMNIVNDKIYYLTVSELNTIDIKSVKTNGDSLKKIKTIYTPITKIYIQDGYAYYVTNKDGNGIVKLNIETGEENKIFQANIYDFVLEDNLIYFTDSVGTLFSVTTSGTNLEVIIDTENIKNIQIFKKWIYYYDDIAKSLCKIKKDGTSKKVVSTLVNNEIYNVTSKKIYYFDEINKQICSLDLNGKTSRVIANLNTNKTKINIIKNTIYYLDNSKDETQIYQMYRIKTNGKEMKSIDY